jgi:hypothetical protein
MTRRTIILTAILLVLLAVVAHLCYGYWARSEAYAARAAEDLAATKRILASIEKLDDRPELASDHERLAAETTGRIEEAARQAGISPAGLAHINPQSPQRLGDSPYKQKPTQVLLKSVTLEQLVKMTHRLSGDAQSLLPRSLRLTAPRNSDTGPFWNAELVLTYLIYDPPKLDGP